MRRWLALGVLLCSIAVGQRALAPMSDEIGQRPYVIQNKWAIGGADN